MRRILTCVRGHKGFTMIEVMTALVILSIGILALISTFGRAIHTNSASGIRTVAIELAQEKIEELKVMPLTAIQAETENINVNKRQYNRMVTVSERSDGNIKLCNVTVSVSWLQGDHTEQVRLFTIFR